MRGYLQVLKHAAEMGGVRVGVFELSSHPCSSFTLRVVMPNPLVRSIDRRGFLRLGLCAGVVGAAGCGSVEEGADAPKVESGNRTRLDAIKTKTQEASTKKKR
jgi:hypothetical protein